MLSDKVLPNGNDRSLPSLTCSGSQVSAYIGLTNRSFNPGDTTLAINQGDNQNPVLIAQDSIFDVVPDNNLTKSKSNKSKSKTQKLKKSKNIRLGLLNINSIGNEYNSKKLSFIHDYLSNNQISFLALTEYLNTEDNNLDVYHMNHEKFPIISHPDIKRVGIAVPGFLFNSFKIIDSWFLTQERTQKSNKIAQILTVEYHNGDVKFNISVIYIAPDITSDKRTEVFNKIVTLSKENPNYIALGDINFNQKVAYNKNVLEEHFDDHKIEQIVSQVTRHSKYTDKDGKVSHRNTTVDLIFVSEKFHKRCSTPKIRKKTPSDHYLVEVDLAYDAPALYTEKIFLPDPTRRPAIPKKKLPQALIQLAILFQTFQIDHAEKLQSECFRTIEQNIRKVLDIFCPLNNPEPKTMRIYRELIDDKTRVAKNRKKLSFGKLKRAKRQLRKKINEQNLERVERRKRAYKYESKRFKKALKKFQNEKNKSEAEELKNNPSKFWDFIDKCKKIKKSSVASRIKIAGKTGQDLAEKMRDYLYKRARLVSDDDIKKHENYIPLCKKDFKEVHNDNDFIFNKTPVGELYFPKGKKPSLACGPDTISHRHLQDLWSVLEEPIQFAMNKPLDGFWNIDKHYLRLILKADSGKSSYTEKDVRPICEANILAKYGPIRAFINELKEEICPKLNDNQYSLSGKGPPLAIYDMFNNINYYAAQKKPMLVAIWDFSNAFCTFSHKALLKILESYNLSDGKIKLCKYFLDQSGSQIKMDDAEGHYISSISFTFRGGPQGQIGVDLMFIISNDNLQPHKLSPEEVAERQKYVDDWADFLTADTFDNLIKLFESNVDALLKGATSVGLKLNDSKTQILPINCNFLDFPDYYDKRSYYETYDEELDEKVYKFKLIKNAEILKFNFSINPTKKPTYINVTESAENLVSRIKSIKCYINSSRKKYHSLKYRLRIAGALIHSKLDKIGPIYACANVTSKKKIETAIRVVIRLAGLDSHTPADACYGLSIKLRPEDIANKQIIILGLKKHSAQDILDNRCRVKMTPGIYDKPCDLMFAKEFNKLPIEIRKKILTYLAVFKGEPKKRFDHAKGILKQYYKSKIYDKSMYHNKNDYYKKMLSKYRYRKSKVKRRIEITRAKNLNNPSEHADKISSTTGPEKNVNGQAKKTQLKTKVVTRARTVKKKKT